MKGMNNTGPIDTTYDIDMMVIVVVVVVVVVVENFSIHFYFILFVSPQAKQILTRVSK